MKVTNIKAFYDNDKKEYLINENKKFLEWLNKQITNGYIPFIDIHTLQSLIDHITLWYEIKYSDDKLEYEEANTKFQKSIRKFSNMDFNELMFILPEEELSIIECKYRSHNISNNEKMINISVKKKRNLNENSSLNKFPDLLLHINKTNGKILTNSYDKTLINSSTTIEELLRIFEEILIDEYDLTELKQSVNNHNVDLELRKKVLMFSALKILYSKNTIPEYGYKRAKNFIKEFNRNIPHLKLSIIETTKDVKTTKIKKMK